MCSPMYRSTGIFCAAEGEKGSVLFLGSKYLKKFYLTFSETQEMIRPPKIRTAFMPKEHILSIVI